MRKSNMTCEGCAKHISPLKKVKLKSIAGDKEVVKPFWLCSACRRDRKDLA